MFSFTLSFLGRGHAAHGLSRKMAVVSDTAALTQRLKSCSSREERASISPWCKCPATQGGRDSALASVSGLSSLCKRIGHSVPTFPLCLVQLYGKHVCASGGGSPQLTVPGSLIPSGITVKSHSPLGLSDIVCEVK